jgi:hypothetical protein
VGVTDTGIGIEANNLKNLFQLFGFVKDKFDRNKNGIGLGLAISHMIVQKFHGDIQVHSHYGQGTTFTFRFKIHVGEAPVQAEAECQEHDQLVLVWRWVLWADRDESQTQEYQDIGNGHHLEMQRVFE